MTDLRRRLLVAFEGEHREHLDALRAALSKLRPGQGMFPDQVEQALRAAHTLKGSARAVDLAEVEEMAHQLESLFAGPRAGFEDADLKSLHGIVDAIEDRVARALREAFGEGPPGRSDASTDGSEERGATVRLSAESLDRLLGVTREILVEQRQQATLRAQADRLASGLAELEQCWSGGPDRELPEKLRSLVRDSRALARAQRGHSETLGRLGARLQREVRRARMVEAGGLLRDFGPMVRNLADSLGKKIRLVMTGLDVQVDREVLQSLKDPVMHLLRNAVDHGLESPAERRRQGKHPTGRIDLRLRVDGARLTVEVEDDGRGLDPESDLRQLAAPGFTTATEVTALSGRGVGLSVADQAARALGGAFDAVGRPAGGACFTMTVPVSAVSQRLLLVAAGGQIFGLPSHSVARLLRLPSEEVSCSGGHPALLVEDTPVPLVGLASLLALDAPAQTRDGHLQAILLRAPFSLAVAVDELIGSCDAVLRPLEVPGLPPGRFAGALLLEDGSVGLVLNPAGLLDPNGPAPGLVLQEAAPEKKAPTILVVDDSITTRTLETALLEMEGYRVIPAVDGLEALEKLKLRSVDLVISDIQMPRMDGFTLLERIKADPATARLPVVLLTSLAEPAERERGLALGAEAYLVKQRFQQRELLETVRQLVGVPA